MSVWKGKAKRIDKADWAEEAEAIGVPEANLRALAEVECRGSGFDKSGRVIMLFEPHKFYKNLSGSQRAEAVRRGLAYPKWGTKPYPSDSYPRLMAACEINQTAALMSCSWGLGQIMGEYSDECGYKSPEDFVQAFADDEQNQLDAVCKLLVTWKVADDLAAGRVDVVALKWNGKGYKKNNYHGKLRDAIAMWTKKLGTKTQERGVIKLGDKGPAVKELQTLLQEHGYMPGLLDGDFGTETRNAILAWKADNNIALRPVMTLSDVEALRNSPMRPISVERANATVSEVKEESKIAKYADTIKKVAVGVGAPVVAAATADDTGTLDKVDQVVEKAERGQNLVQRIMGVLGDSTTGVLHFISEHRFLFIVGALVVVGYFGHKVLMRRVRDHQAGKTL